MTFPTQKDRSDTWMEKLLPTPAKTVCTDSDKMEQKKKTGKILLM